MQHLWRTSVARVEVDWIITRTVTTRSLVRSRGSWIRSLRRCADCLFYYGMPRSRRNTLYQVNHADIYRLPIVEQVKVVKVLRDHLEENLKQDGAKPAALSFSTKPPPSIGPHANHLNVRRLAAAERLQKPRFRLYKHDTAPTLCCYQVTSSSPRFGEPETEEGGT